MSLHRNEMLSQSLVYFLLIKDTWYFSHRFVGNKNISYPEFLTGLFFRYVCLDQLFAHLDKFRQSCLSKDSHAAEAFLARPVLQEAFTTARAAEKVEFRTFNLQIKNETFPHLRAAVRD